MKIFRFGIMGAGNIAEKFCKAAGLVKNCQVVAVSSKSMERAQKWARQNEVPNAYDSYEEMLRNEELDCVYIAVTTQAHYELTLLCLKYNIPVLCEKAMFTNSTHAEKAFELAREKKVFVMEAMWSRFLPTIKVVKDWLEHGCIGEVTLADIGLGFLAPQDPNNRYFSPALGGGASYDLTVYAYELMTYMLGEDISAKEVTAVWSESGVDITDHVVLHYGNRIATLNTSFVAAIDEKLIIYGERGRIEIPHAHFAEEAFLYNEKGEWIDHYKDEQTINGFTYEIEEVIKCIQNGDIQSDIVPHKLTIDCARLFDAIWNTK